MELVVFWILCGVVGAALLSSHGKAGTGCLAGGLLGPLGILLAWIEKNKLDRAQDLERENVRSRELRALVAANAPRSADTHESRQERDCPFCAERILARAKICKHCGRDMA